MHKGGNGIFRKRTSNISATSRANTMDLEILEPKI